ncbi:Serine/threonine-protein kinase PknD [Streptomyces californicus]
MSPPRSTTRDWSPSTTRAATATTSTSSCSTSRAPTSADHLAEQDPYPWPWAVAVAAQLCAVLCAVHAVPIVHRDLKPRNVMVRPDGTVTVLDLGVASVLDTDTTRLTHTGSPIGSPAYMAPEQAMGGAVGPYTDLYALGVLLHELLSGDVPFAGSTALGVLHRHLYEPPAPVRRTRPEVPAALEALVLRLLAKDPQDRPASAQEVYEELAPLLPKHGTPSAPLDPTRPFLRPHAPWPDRATTPAPVPAPAAFAAPPTGLGAPLSTTPPPGPAAPRSFTPPPYAPPRSAPVRPTAPPHATPPPPARPDVARAVDEVKKLLGEGRITQAVDVLGAILPAAAAEHGERSPVVRILRKQYAATLMDDGSTAAPCPNCAASPRTAPPSPDRPTPRPSSSATTRPSASNSSGRPEPRSSSTARAPRTTRTPTGRPPPTPAAPSTSGTASDNCSSPWATTPRDGRSSRTCCTTPNASTGRTTRCRRTCAACSATSGTCAEADPGGGAAPHPQLLPNRWSNQWH